MPTTSVEKLNVLDGTGVQQMAATIFSYIESTYVRRSVYESDMASLVSRIDAIDAYNRYTFNIDQSTGSLTFTIPDGTDANLSVNNDGYLVLTSEDGTVDRALTHYSFTQDANGTLYLTIN